MFDGKSRTPNYRMQKVIQQAIQRNQLTGSHRFIDEVEKRNGIWVEFRGMGRPRRLLSEDLLSLSGK